MASLPSGLANGASNGFHFTSGDILCSYEDNNTNDCSSNGIYIDPAKDFHASRMAKTSIVPATAYSSSEDSLSQDVIATVEKTMRTCTDNLLRFLEGISSRLSNLELYCYNLDKSIGAMRSDLNSDHEEADSKLKSLDKHLQEVHRSVQILRDKQELAETQKELAKLQLIRKESSSSSHTQSNEERSSPSSIDPRRIDNASDTQNLDLALVLPHQLALRQHPGSSSHQVPAPNVSQATQQPHHYLMPPTPSNPHPWNQYLPSDPHYRIPPSTSSSLVTQSPPRQQLSQYQQLQHQEFQWPQQLPQQVDGLTPHPPSIQSQVRPPVTNVYTCYSTSQATNHLPPRNSMPTQLSYSGIPIQVPSNGDVQPHGYSGAGGTDPQQPMLQHMKGSFPPASSFTVYDSENARSHYPSQPSHTAQGGPQNFMVQSSSQSQFPRINPNNDHVISTIQRGWLG
ncbi:integrator complex subunit 3 homolog [Vigna radiata var. radiata]|uniref:Integrator complex subunit 3 homolog n=1 Tax=Vigna radiata var. radiata TaxID=3916 RepID=A0A1S3TD35_VIGRR|nr:integrator complex subunit 3 homolog [Vigna radiata var. radiata]